jgi:hypothetical protein
MEDPFARPECRRPARHRRLQRQLREAVPARLALEPRPRYGGSRDCLPSRVLVSQPLSPADQRIQRLPVRLVAPSDLTFTELTAQAGSRGRDG